MEQRNETRGDGVTPASHLQWVLGSRSTSGTRCNTAPHAEHVDVRNNVSISHHETLWQSSGPGVEIVFHQALLPSRAVQTRSTECHWCALIYDESVISVKKRRTHTIARFLRPKKCNQVMPHWQVLRPPADPMVCHQLMNCLRP